MPMDCDEDDSHYPEPFSGMSSSDEDDVIYDAAHSPRSLLHDADKQGTASSVSRSLSLRFPFA